MIGTLLDGIARNEVAVAILNITGIRTVGADGAVVPGQAAKAASCVGARVVLTGISACPRTVSSPPPRAAR